MVQDSDFFLQKFIRYESGLRFFTQKFIRYGSGLKFFSQKFLQYGSGLRIFSTKISSLWFRTWNFFYNFFFTMAQDLEFFSPQKFLSHGSGLWIFFPNNNSSLWLRTWNFLKKFSHYGSGLRIFSFNFFIMTQDLEIFP